MSRLEVPLIGRTLHATGDVILRAELDLLIRDRKGLPRRVTFRVDSGADMSTMPAALARALNLPISATPVRGLLHSGSLEVRSGLLRTQVPGMGGPGLIVPCFFLGDIDAPTDPDPRPILVRNLLGLSGVIDKLRITFDGTPTPDAPHGRMVVEAI